MPRNTAQRTSKNAIMLLAGTGIRMVASFAFVLYSAALLGVESFGKFSIAVHYFELFLSLTATAISILLTRDLVRWPKHLNVLLSSASALALALCCLSPAFMLTLAIAFRYSADTMQAIFIGCFALFPSVLCVLLEAVFVARERAEFVTMGTAIESFFRIALGFLVLKLGFGILALMGVLLCVRIVLLIAYWRSLRSIAAPYWSFSWRATRRFLMRWRVFAAENWMSTIYASLDVLLLSWISGEVATGVYSAAWKVVRLGTVVAKSFTTAVFPVMSRVHGESRETFARLYHQTIRVMCILALPAAISISILSERIVLLLYRDEYIDSAAVLQVLVWVLVVEFLNPFLSHVLFAQGKQKQSMIVAAVALSTNLVATYLLVKQFDATGAAAGSVLAGFVAMICYLGFTVPKAQLRRTTDNIIRVAFASLGTAFVVHYERSAPWISLISIAVISYAALLFMFQAVRLSDLRQFKLLFLARTTT